MWYLIVLSLQNIQNPLPCAQFIIVCIAMSTRMMHLGSNDGSLASSGLISNLVPVGLIRKWTLDMDICIDSHGLSISSNFFFFHIL